MTRLTKKGALQITDDLDRLAQLTQTEYETLGIPQHIAMDFAKRCDILSDGIWRTAGIDRDAADWDPEQIGEENAGPEVQEPDEPYMNQEFSQQENRELRERQQAGDLGPKAVDEPQAPTPGVQASFGELVEALKAGDFDEARVAKALRLASAVVKQGKGKVPPEFLEHQKGKKEDKEDDKKEDKEASFDHGYDLAAQ